MSFLRVRLAALALLVLGSLPTAAFAASPVANGAGAYTGENDQTTSYDLPLVRTDSSYDTIIHLSNPTTGSSTASLTFLNANGGTIQTLTQPLATWVSTDVDVLALLGNSAGVAAATVTAPTGIAVAVDVINGALPGPDNVDSYAGIPTSSAQLTTNEPVVISGSSGNYQSYLYLQNTTTTVASATVTFYQYGKPYHPNAQTSGSITVSVPANGEAVVSVQSALNNPSLYLGPAVITSSQPLAVVLEYTGLGYGISPMVNTVTGGHAYVSRYDVATTGGWNSGILIMNTGTNTATYTISFYNPDGSAALNGTVPVVVTLTIPPLETQAVGALAYGLQPPGLTAGSLYSAVVDGSAGSMAVSAIKAQGTYPQFSVMSGYTPLNGSLPGQWAYLPGIRKSAADCSLSGTACTSFSLMNPQGTTQTYALVYWSQAGQLVETTNVTLAANGFQNVSQATDSTLPVGFDGSVQITNITGSVLPIAAVELDATTFAQPNPTPTSTPSVSPTPTMTPTQTPTSSGPRPEVYLPLVGNNAPASGW